MPDTKIPQKLNILVVDDEINIRKTLAVCLETEGHSVVAVSNFEDAVAEASRRSFELAFVDLRLGTADGLDLISQLLTKISWLKIIVITAYASIDTAVEAMRRGARDFIQKPWDNARLLATLHTQAELARALRQSRRRCSGLTCTACASSDKVQSRPTCLATRSQSRQRRSSSCQGWTKRATFICTSSTQ